MKPPNDDDQHLTWLSQLKPNSKVGWADLVNFCLRLGSPGPLAPSFPLVSGGGGVMRPASFSSANQ